MFWHDLPLVLQHSGSLVAPVSSKPERYVNTSLQGHLHEVLPTFFCVAVLFYALTATSSDLVQQTGQGGMGTMGAPVRRFSTKNALRGRFDLSIKYLHDQFFKVFGCSIY